ncbi:hypothetical protein CfE428DRAFT_3204 [Chthoniobacter flavus Ellin428]|uniref:Toprim domain-containing protein n=2 Tax=Chthoniobacter flavus TaxID=191863 RepID=B4D2R6_9BACT|nr:hypothetical protein [Chthoniobacter flavus]EDY19027.1 hypothetical protein CfE428DRAFT_3204 [Chthoniobacter flavus Ellin428]TCO86791.1 hypothetical protein EV701_1266 [Chthoniobacter flavus]
MRVESPRPLKNGGWFHSFDGEAPMLPPPLPKPQPPPPDMGVIMQRYWKAAHPGLEQEAELLGVSAQSLRWLGAAYAEERKALAIPMYDGTSYNAAHPIGIRLRSRDGRKFAVTGSKAGVFYPYGAYHAIVPNQRLLICEGPSDSAAALDLGFFPVGRASCRGGTEIILNIIGQLWPDEVIVVTDNDGPGVGGARALLEVIPRPAKLFVPPTKDLRGFLRAGGSHELLDSMVKNLLWYKK